MNKLRDVPKATESGDEDGREAAGEELEDLVARPAAIKRHEE